MRQLAAGASVPERDSSDILVALNSVAQSHDVDPAAIAGIIHTESLWDTRCITGSYIGLTQVGPELPRLLGLSREQFLSLSAAEQIRAYGKWLDHYRYAAQVARYGMDVGVQPLARQAAVLQAMQFAPNGTIWKIEFGRGNYRVPSTSSKQARFLGDTSIHDMEAYYEGFFRQHPPEYSEEVQLELAQVVRTSAVLAGDLDQIVADGRRAGFESTRDIFEGIAARGAERYAGAAADDDPAFPAAGEISDTADLDTARVLANVGAGAATMFEAAAPGITTFAGMPLAFDLSRAQAFLDACRNATPRVTYGLGAKVPFFGAVPGRDFTKVDCSGFVREAVRLATNRSIPFPDGSVVQHDWVRAHGFETSSIDAAKQADGVVRIAFLSPRDAPHGIGHVVLISGARTLESHGGVGPDSRAWDGTSWQAKTSVYVFSRNAQVNLVQGAATIQAAAMTAGASFTVRHGHRYRATVTLGFLEQFASDDQVAKAIAGYGFTDVVVTGSGGTRQAEATWNGPDTTAPIDSHLSQIVDLSGPAAGSSGGVGAPAIIRSPGGHATGNISTSVFSTESLPAHHDDLLIVKIKAESLVATPVMAMNAIAAAPPTSGLSALSYYQRAGMIKRILPLRRHEPTAEPGYRMTALSTLMVAAPPQSATDTSGGVNFIQMEPGQNVDQLHRALAADPNVESVDKVPARYLLARPPVRKPPDPSGPTIQAVPPREPLHWNLKKILWEEARDKDGFKDAAEVRVAVLDTGVDAKHPDLKVDAYHWQQPDLTRPVSAKDIIGHGTHVSGTIAANIKSLAVKGVCDCKLSVWKIFDDEPTYIPSLGQYVYVVNPVMYRRALAACLEDPKVDVINLSIGGPAPPDPQEQAYFEELIAARVTICAAMGNERQQGSRTSYPAAIPGVIAVGATGLDDSVTLFSNSGNHISVSAPGKAIWSTLPTYGGQTGFWVDFGSDGTPRQGKAMRREMNYDAWDGTSMATPHVSGCAALLIAKAKAAGNQLTPDDVRQALMTTADKVPGMNGANFSTDYGAGRVNLYQLL